MSEIRALLESAPDLLGLGVAYAPNLKMPTENQYETCIHTGRVAGVEIRKETFAPYMKRSGDLLQDASVQYDYSDPMSGDNLWYSRAARGICGWAVVYGKASGKLVSIYSAPLYLSGKDGISGAVIATHMEGSLAEKISGFLRQFNTDAHSLATAVEAMLYYQKLEEQGGLNTEVFEECILDILSSCPYVSGLGVVFSPEYLQQVDPDTDTAHCALYYSSNQAGDSQRVELEYDYTDENDADSIWYHNSSSTGPNGALVKGRWHTVYGKASKQRMAVYSYPVFSRSRQAGVVILTIPLDRIRSVISELTQEKDHLVFIVDAADADRDGLADGRLVLHPYDVISSQKRLTVYDPEVGFNHQALALWNESLGKKRLVGTVTDAFGRSARLSIETIDGSDLKLCTYTVQKSPLFFLNSCLPQLRMAVVLGAVALVLLMIEHCVVNKSFRKQRVEHLWRVSMGGTFILLLAVGVLWYIEYNRTPDQMEAARSLAEVRSAANNSRNPPLSIPSGVFLQSLEFENAVNVRASGYIWQKYRIRKAAWENANEQCIYMKDQGRDVTLSRSCDDQKLLPGFIFPEAVSSSISEAYRRIDKPFAPGDHFDALRTITIGWHFEITLRQPFDYTSFPFDHENIRLRLRHREFDQNIIMIPDQDSYVAADPTVNIGVDQSLSVSGWYLRNSYFDYKEAVYASNFGISNYDGNQSNAELHFNVALKRNFSDAFIGHIIPVLVVLFMLFAMLITISPKRAHVEKFGTSAFGTLRITSALFFVALMSHIQLRNTVQVLEVIYLEYLYFLTYGAILFITVFSIAIAAKQDSLPVFLRFRHSLAVKLLFWPVFLTAFLLFTVALFNR